MSNPLKLKIMKKQIVLSAVCLLLAVFIPSSCKKDEAVPEVLKVLSLTEKAGNYGYPELSQEVAKWIFALPIAKGPLTDPDGSHHASGVQPLSNIVILLGTTDGKSSRNITIPSDKYVFLPMIFSTNWYYEKDDCNPDYKPATGQTAEAFLETDIVAEIDGVKNMTAKLDGVELATDWTKYRVKSKSFTFAPDKEFLDTNCDYSKQKAIAITDGYYLLLKIPKGKHTLTYNANAPSEPTPHQPDTWNLTVE